ncbi:MAG: hypothetical protein H0V42_07960 [Nocardioidaceae bacterium]|nr:hypothetical protein [Nocardioidaceae bacterium]
MIGTPGYFAPEQIRGADPDPLQDVYAAAVVTLQTLTGEAPAASGDLPAYRPRTALEHAVAALVGEMTADDPRRRPQGARAARVRLDGIHGSHDLAAGSDPGCPVEVFDHVPDLPDGWSDRGPATEVQRPAQ